MNLGDMRFTKDVLAVDLWYPNLEPDPGAEPRTPDHPVAVEIGLMHVRAADSILIEYDFERDGYVIKQASIFSWPADATEHDQDWQEVAFVEAWGRERETEEDGVTLKPLAEKPDPIGPEDAERAHLEEGAAILFIDENHPQWGDRSYRLAYLERLERWRFAERRRLARVVKSEP